MAPVRGLEEVEANLDLQIAKIATSSREVAVEASDQFVEESQALAPVLQVERTDRKPGDLRDSIEVKAIVETEGMVVVEAGTTLFYGPDQEFGTFDVPPHPFIRPPYEKMKATFVAVAAEKLRVGA